MTFGDQCPHAGEGVARQAQAASRSSRRRILPTVDFGSASMKRTIRRRAPRQAGKPEAKLVYLPNALEDEDLLEMIDAGLLQAVVVDDWKARMWAQVLPKVKVHEDIMLRPKTKVGWGIRKDSPKLAAELNRVLSALRQGRRNPGAAAQVHGPRQGAEQRDSPAGPSSRPRRSASKPRPTCETSSSTRRRTSWRRKRTLQPSVRSRRSPRRRNSQRGVDSRLRATRRCRSGSDSRATWWSSACR